MCLRASFWARVSLLLPPFRDTNTIPTATSHTHNDPILAQVLVKLRALSHHPSLPLRRSIPTEIASPRRRFSPILTLVTETNDLLIYNVKLKVEYVTSNSDDSPCCTGNRTSTKDNKALISSSCGVSAIM